jgi:hypothetical protein
MEASHQLREAIRLVQKAGPNSRDYYVQEAGAFGVAVAEQESRLERLRAVLQEMEALSESVAKHV